MYCLCLLTLWSLLIRVTVVVSQSSYYGYGYPDEQTSKHIKIGGLFDSSDQINEVILKQAVVHLNSDPNVLTDFHMSIKTETISLPYAFHSGRAVCALMKEGIGAIIVGPQSPESSTHTHAICDRYDIPHIDTKWDYRSGQNKYTINLFPHPDILGQAYNDLIDYFQWENLVIIYDSEAGLVKLQNLMKSSSSKRIIVFRPLPPDEDVRLVLKEIQRSINYQNIIIDCGYERTLEVLRQAQQIGMTYYIYRYLLTTLDIQDGDLDDFQYGDAQYWTFRMVDPNQPEVRRATNQLNITSNLLSSIQANFGGNSVVSNTELEYRHRGLTLEQALVFDAVKLLGKALEMNPTSIRKIRPIECNDEDSWTEGTSIINDMRAMPPFQGLTGVIQFNQTGYRTDISLEVIRLQKNGLKRAGLWRYTSSSKFQWEDLEDDKIPIIDENVSQKFKNRTFRVLSMLGDPFCMWRRAEHALEGNERFEGYVIDLVQDISKKLGFTYEIHLTDSYDAFTQQLIDDQADLVAASLTITKKRQVLVDLTMPFMTIGIAILHTVPQAKPPSLFSFLSPFAVEVWMYVAIGFFGVSFVLFVTARVTPYEWDSPFPCIREPEILHNQFSLANSFWFTIGSIMQQGSDLAPKAVSTRMVAGIWWFFTLIMVSSYTANLATFLIVQEQEESIQSLEDLANQNKIKYGCNENGSTMNFFKDSQDPIKKKIWENMAKNFHEVMFPGAVGNDKGPEKVVAEKGKYAFFMENSILDYKQERICGLRQVGPLLDNKGYGIALKKDSGYLDEFNDAILELQENGKLDELKRKWWKEERKESNCQAPSVSDSVKPLQLANVGGVFVVLVGGCIISVFITLAEFLWKAREFPVSEDESLKDALVRDFKFAFMCRGNVKPVKKTSLTSSSELNVGPEGSGSDDERDYI